MKKERLEHIVDAFRRMHVIVVGDVMIDAYIWGMHTRNSPEAPVPVVDVDQREAKLGGAANVALNLQALGARATILSVVGAQGRSEEYLQLMRSAELDTAGILIDEGRKCTVKTRVISNEKHMLRVDEEQTDDISAARQADILASLGRYLREQQVDVIILQDYNKGVLTSDLIPQLIDLAHQHAVPVCVDPKKKNFLSYLGVELFKPNKKELAEGLSVDINGDDRVSVEEALLKLQDRMPHGSSLLTLSEHGVAYATDGAAGHLPVFPRNIVDVSGAGDTVISVAALALAAGADMEEIAWLSNLSGGMACEYVGVRAIDREALRQDALSNL